MIEVAITENDYARANDLLLASVVYAPDDPALSNLRYEVETELKRQRDLDDAISKDGADHPDIAPFRQVLNERMSKAEQYYKEAQKLRKQDQPKKARQYLEDGAIKLWADNPVYKTLLAELSKVDKPPTKRRM